VREAIEARGATLRYLLKYVISVHTLSGENAAEVAVVQGLIARSLLSAAIWGHAGDTEGRGALRFWIDSGRPESIRDRVNPRAPRGRAGLKNRRGTSASRRKWPALKRPEIEGYAAAAIDSVYFVMPSRHF